MDETRVTVQRTMNDFPKMLISRIKTRICQKSKEKIRGKSGEKRGKSGEFEENRGNSRKIEGKKKKKKEDSNSLRPLSALWQKDALWPTKKCKTKPIFEGQKMNITLGLPKHYGNETALGSRQNKPNQTHR